MVVLMTALSLLVLFVGWSSGPERSPCLRAIDDFDSSWLSREERWVERRSFGLGVAVFAVDLIDITGGILRVYALFSGAQSDARF